MKKDQLGIKQDPRRRENYPVWLHVVDDAPLLEGCFVAMMERRENGYLYRSDGGSRVLDGGSVKITIAEEK